MVDFNPPATDEDGLGNEKTTSLGDKASTPDGEGYEEKVHETSENDEDLDV